MGIVTCSDLVRRLQFSNVDDVYSFLPFETRMMDEHSKALLAGQAEIFFDGQFRKASFRVYQHVIKIEAQQTIVPLYAEIEAFSDVCYVPHPTRIGCGVAPKRNASSLLLPERKNNLQVLQFKRALSDPQEVALLKQRVSKKKKKKKKKKKNPSKKKKKKKKKKK